MIIQYEDDEDERGFRWARIFVGHNSTAIAEVFGVDDEELGANLRSLGLRRRTKWVQCIDHREAQLRKA